MRSSAWDTPARSCARSVLCWPAFPLVPVLRSTNSAAAGAALFAGFIATISGSDFSRPCIIGYGSSPSRRGPGSREAIRSDARSPRFRPVPFGRDGVLDHDGASAPRIAAPHMLPSTEGTASASVVLILSRLNIPPHTITVYASWPPSPTGSRNTRYRAGATPYPDRTFTGWTRSAFPGAPPHFLQQSEERFEHGESADELAVFCHQRCQSMGRHVGDQVVEHRPLAEQRVGAALGGV